MRKNGPKPTTLWNAGASLDAQMLRYTVADDRDWDARLMPWDILGSIGHAEGLRRARLLSVNEHRRLVGALRGALKAAERGELVIGPEHEDVHSAVELWLTDRLGALGERVHTGRSRNDQVTVDLRLFLKHRVLDLHALATGLAGALLAFAHEHRRVLWPGYTHQRRAMPSSAGLWAAGYANGLLDTVETLAGLWPRLDRSPLGSAAGYGVPLPIPREAVARALGFGGIDHAVTGVQNARGKLEAAVLFWCTELGHDVAKLATDVILFSAEEFGWLVLPPELSTGSSIMPQKRNPDLFELTRARTALVEGDLAQVMALKGKLAGGYHRDFQFLKAPLMRGLDTTGEMLAMVASALPRLAVDGERARVALTGDILATDEVMRRVRGGEPFRRAYRDVAQAVKRGEPTPRPRDDVIAAARRATGGVGDLGLPALHARLRAAARWQRAERARFDRAMRRLATGR
jgi:argininosuccinate lyase